jgi:FAD/FMN-containing dehydrogenase
VTAAPEVRAIEADLRAALSGEVRFDADSRALYATDASNHRQIPIRVVIPRSVEDVVAALCRCRVPGMRLCCGCTLAQVLRMALHGEKI